MNKNQMTKKTAFTLAMDALNTIETDEAAQAWEVINKEIARLDRAALKAKTTETKADKAKAEFRQAVLEFITEQDAAFRASEIATEFGISVQKASATLNALVAQGALIKVDGEKRTVLFAVPGFETDAE